MQYRRRIIIATDAAAERAFHTAIDAVTTMANACTTLVVRAMEPNEATTWRDRTRREVEMEEVEEVAIAFVQALGEFYKRNRRAIDLVVRAYMLYIFLNLVFQLVLALIQLAFSCALTALIFVFLYKLPSANHMDFIFA